MLFVGLKSLFVKQRGNLPPELLEKNLLGANSRSPPTQRVFPGQLPGLPGSTRFFQPRNDFYQFNFDTLESGYSQFFAFWFEVNQLSEGVKLCSACSKLPVRGCLPKRLFFIWADQSNLLAASIKLAQPLPKRNPKKKNGDF